MNLSIPSRQRSKDPVEGMAHVLDDVRRALSHEAEHITEMATQIGRDAGKQAGKATDDAGKQASNLATDVSTTASAMAQRFLKGASHLGNQIAATGRKSAEDLGRDARSLGDDLKNVRVTTEPKKSGPDMMPGIALLGGFTAGAALMYFLDPEQGNRRRALLRDQLTKWTRIGRETAAGKAKDLRNRSIGAMHEARKQVGIPVGDEAVDQPGQPTGNGWESADPSTSDTWGEQPITSEGRIG